MNPITEPYKVGEAAKQVGLSVRTLHHYEFCGLLRPRRKEPAGHRVYDEEDLRRLRQIRLLRSYDLDLETIRACLQGTTMTPVDSLSAKLSALREHIDQAQRQAKGLESLLINLRSEDYTAYDPSSAKQDLALETSQTPEAKQTPETRSEQSPVHHAFELAIDMMSLASETIEEHHLDAWSQITRELGIEGIAQRKQQWRKLVADLRASMLEDRPPNDPYIIDLARRWHCLIDDAYFGNFELRAKFCQMIGSHPSLCKRWMESLQIDRELLRYLGRATDHLQFDDRGRPVP